MTPLTLRMKPPRGRTGIAARASMSGPTRSTATISWSTPEGISSSGPNATAPVQQTTPSRPPSASAAATMSGRAAAVSARSNTRLVCSPTPRSASPILSRLVRARRAPRPASAAARGRPMPPEAPTSRTRAPLSDRVAAGETLIAAPPRGFRIRRSELRRCRVCAGRRSALRGERGRPRPRRGAGMRSGRPCRRRRRHRVAACRRHV